MIEAYILIKAEAGKVSNVASQLRAIQGVKSVSAITGPADLIAQVEAGDPQQLAELVMGNFHKVDGVKETDTRFVVG